MTLIIHFSAFSWILWFNFAEHLFENGQWRQYFIPAWMNLCLHMGPGPPCSALALSTAGMLLCVAVINARRRVHWSWCGGREFCQSHLLREVRGHRQRNVVLIFWAKKFYKIISPIFWCEAWRKIIIKQNWRREGYLPNDIFPILSASIPRKKNLKSTGKVLAVYQTSLFCSSSLWKQICFWSMRG